MKRRTALKRTMSRRGAKRPTSSTWTLVLPLACVLACDSDSRLSSRDTDTPPVDAVWRSISVGMSREAVEQALGEPSETHLLIKRTESIWGPLDISEWCVRSVNIATGMDCSLDDAKKTAERIWNMMRAFMVREGFRRKDDKLPKRFMEEPIPTGPSKGMVISRENLDLMLDEYYSFRGWDLKTGIPTPERLVSLGLDDVAQDMKAYLAAAEPSKT